MYFVDQLRVLVVSLPELARLLFLAQMLGGVPVPVVAAEKPASKGDSCRNERSIYERRFVRWP